MFCWALNLSFGGYAVDVSIEDVPYLSDFYVLDEGRYLTSDGTRAFCCINGFRPTNYHIQLCQTVLTTGALRDLDKRILLDV